jgi:hypothetical protein
LEGKPIGPDQKKEFKGERGDGFVANSFRCNVNHKLLAAL